MRRGRPGLCRRARTVTARDTESTVAATPDTTPCPRGYPFAPSPAVTATGFPSLICAASAGDTVRRMSSARGSAIWTSGWLASTDARSEEHTSELQSHSDLVCRLLLEKKKKNNKINSQHNYEQ